MKKSILSILLCAVIPICANASDEKTVTSPDGNLVVTVGINSGSPYYNVSYKGVSMLENSPLGLVANIGKYDSGMSYVSSEEGKVSEAYAQDRIKRSFNRYEASTLSYTLKNAEGGEITVLFQVSDNDIAFKYTLAPAKERLSAVIYEEATGFDLPSNATTFLTEQALPMTGWSRTKPSYEEGYCYDGKIGQKSNIGCGFTFPGLFHVGENGWVLVSETGVTGKYCASHLSDPTADGMYKVEFPNEGEINGWGSSSVALALPGDTPWRTITVADNLAPIVETTVPFDVVKQLYEPSKNFQYGKSTWSWIMWQDGATVYDDQITYIDFAHDLGWSYCLIDALWDTQIGREKTEELIKYANSKGVGIFLWYNSNGAWNDAPQGPRGCLDNGISRKAEMKWLKSLGVKGLKVDFFGSDKQSMIQMYEEILSDANEYGLMIIFHGCTIPRGWERMYPNYVGSEAVLASENLMFGQQANDMEATSAATHPFLRNTIGCMEFGGSTLNRRYSRDNKHGNTRRTTDAFELAAAVLFQNPIQNFALAPNNLEDVPEFEIDFMKKVPTTWDDIKFVDGYPGKYCVLARRHLGTWYLVGINAEKTVKELSIDISKFGFKDNATYYFDNADGSTSMSSLKNLKDNVLKVKMQPDGGFVVKF